MTLLHYLTGLIYHLGHEWPVRVGAQYSAILSKCINCGLEAPEPKDWESIKPCKTSGIDRRF